MKTALIPILNRPTIKILSLVIGYFLWLNFSFNQVSKIDLNLPLFFYGMDDSKKLEAPTHIKVQVSGLRRALKSKSNSVHIDLKGIKSNQELDLNINSNNIHLYEGLRLEKIYTDRIKVKEISVPNQA
jgi:hypothetical protein